MSDNRSTEHIGDEFIALAVPDEQSGAGAAAAIDFEKFVALVAGNLILVNFVLQHAAGPEHADDVRVL